MTASEALDLRDHLRLRVGGVEELAQAPAVGRRADEREGDVVDAERERELEIAQVLLGHRRHRDGDARDVDALVRAHGASHHDHGPHALAVRLLDP
jgi:hypothetical protein